MSLNDILAIFQVIGIFAVLYGIVIGIKQLKLNRQQRRDLAVMECARSFEDSEFTEAYRLLAELEPIYQKRMSWVWVRNMKLPLLE